MKGSVVTPKTAGMESTAKTRSDSSMTTKTSSSGVAVRTPSTCVKNASANERHDSVVLHRVLLLIIAAKQYLGAAEQKQCSKCQQHRPKALQHHGTKHW